MPKVVAEERSRAGRPEPGSPKLTQETRLENHLVLELGLTQVLKQDQGNSCGQDGPISPWGALAQPPFSVYHEAFLDAELAGTRQLNQNCSPSSPGKP